MLDEGRSTLHNAIKKKNINYHHYAQITLKIKIQRIPKIPKTIKLSKWSLDQYLRNEHQKHHNPKFDSRKINKAKKK